MWIEALVLDSLLMIPMFKASRWAKARNRFSNYYSYGHLTRLILW